MLLFITRTIIFINSIGFYIIKFFREKIISYIDSGFKSPINKKFDSMFRAVPDWKREKAEKLQNLE